MKKLLSWTKNQKTKKTAKIQKNLKLSWYLIRKLIRYWWTYVKIIFIKTIKKYKLIDKIIQFDWPYQSWDNFLTGIVWIYDEKS